MGAALWPIAYANLYHKEALELYVQQLQEVKKVNFDKKNHLMCKQL